MVCASLLFDFKKFRRIGMKVKAVIFDMDGLMFDTERIYNFAWKHAAGLQEIDISEETLLKIKGSSKAITEKILREDIKKPFDMNKMRQDRDKYTWSHIEKNGLPVKSGLIELLEFLKSNNIKTALATSTKQETASKYLELSQTKKYFDELIFGDMVERGKPNPDIFILACEKIDENTGDCLVLEDSRNGINAGYRAGCKVIMIPDLIKPNQEDKEIVDMVLEDLSKVISIIN